MINLFKKRRVVFFGLTILLGLFLAFIQIQAVELEVGLEYGAQTGLGTQDIRVTIANIIRVFLGLLGIVAVALIIYGGYLYMTAAGMPEKIDRAKKLLTGALIGLVIILSAFAIASFILSTLVGVVGLPSGPEPGPSPEPTPTPPPPSYCADPTGDTFPWLCIDPNSGLRGAGVTVTAGNIGATPGEIFMIDKDSNRYEVEVLKCKDTDSGWFNPIANSDLSRLVIKIPEDLTLAGNDYHVVAVTAENLSTFDKDWGIGNRQDIFTLTGENLSDEPILICLLDENDNEVYSAQFEDSRKLKGQRFGAAQGRVTFNNQEADILDWGEEIAQTSVPLTSSGFVKLISSANKTSNGLWTDIFCETGDGCLTGCCLNGRCADAEYCLPYIGQACADAPACTDAGCYPDLVCAADCTCQEPVLPGPGQGCDAEPEVAGCQLGECAQGLYCSSAENCTCQYLPVITDVIPDNGAPGNFVTIIGRGFGSSLGQVIFLGDETNPNDDKAAILPMGCGAENIWKDNQVIIEIPEGAVTGPLKLINADNLEDTTSNDTGVVLDFVINDINRPSICGLNPDEGEFGQQVEIDGKNFGEIIGRALIGGLEFDNKANWEWSDLLIKNLLAPNIEPATLPVQVQTEDEDGNPLNSNPYNFKILPSAVAPRIDYIDPDFGPTGQYVTIFGSNFGNEIGLVRFLNTEGETDFRQWQAADTNFPAGCANAYWHDSYIVVKVPSQALTNSQIVVETQNGLFSNTVNFNRCQRDPNTCPLRPGICRIQPDQGPIGTTGVTLYGENFGSYLAGQTKVNFWQNKEVVDNLANYWTGGQVGSGQIDSDLPMTVPVGAETGPVQLIDQFGIRSNQIKFEVLDCRDDPDICAPGLVCCQRNGICLPLEECAEEIAPMCTYSWSFTTGEIPDVFTPPQVVEELPCGENTQSPTPWKNSTDNCANIWISARFNQEMNTTTLNENTILVQNCGTGNVFDETQCGNTISSSAIEPMDDIGFIFKPVGDLIPNTWYKVTLRSGDQGIKSAQNIMLDGDFDRIPGGDYAWAFRIRNSAEPCEIDKVVVNPPDAVIRFMSQTQEYNAFALAENCNILNGDIYNWSWYKVYSNGQEEAAQALLNNYGIALISENETDAGRVRYKQIATPVKQGLVYVAAQALDKKDDNNRLSIDLNIPEIFRIHPDNGLMHPDINAYVTIYGRNFGDSQGASRVLFEEAAAELADCPNSWTDTMIQVIVPKAARVSSEPARTYRLPTPDKEPGMILFYDMEDLSNVILEDKVGNFDGEIKGAQRINDQFGRALYFDGQSAYVKLLNNLNLNTGSLEFWFKPEGTGRQALFSASDGTAINIFSIDYDSGTNRIYITIDETTNSVSAGAVKSNQWNHLVYTFDGSRYVFYINGMKFYHISGGNSVFAASNFSTKGFLADVANKTDVLIGAKNSGNGIQDFYQGRLDNFAVYNRVLTAENVKKNFGLALGQVLLLSFEETGGEIKDYSANDFKNMTLADPALNFRIDQGRFGRAISFNNNNRININDNPSFVFDSGLTIEGWFKPANTSLKTIFEANNLALGVLNCGGSNQFCFRVLIADEETQTASFRYAALPLDRIKLNEWNYFAGVYDGQKIKIYLNGEKQEYEFKGAIYQNNNFKSACLGGCANNFSGDLDEIVVYNKALSESEIFKRVGAKNNSQIKVRTASGEAISAQTFKYSENVYPFLCSLVPDSGLEGTQVALGGDNFGDSHKTVWQGREYEIGSYTLFNHEIIDLADIRSWANILINTINPFSDVGSPEIPVFASIDPYSEPYIDGDKSGAWDEGEVFADIDGSGEYYKHVYEVEDFETGETVGIISLDSNELPFYLAPVITAISPDNGPKGQWVTIKGYNFGHDEGEVYFYNNQEAELAPCYVRWTNTYILSIVPEGAQSGDVYIKTAKGLESNRVRFTVNNNPLGAGLCDVYTVFKTCDGGSKSGFICQSNANCPGGSCSIDNRSKTGTPGDQVFAEGDRFGNEKELSDLVFTFNNPAEINLWSNRNLAGVIPAGAITGDVKVVKRLETGRSCVGFSIGNWCPSGEYEIIYQDVPSNPIFMTISDICQTGYLGVRSARDGGFPIETYSLDSQGQREPYEEILLSLSASDGAYLYTTGVNWISQSLLQSYISAEDTPRTIWKIGTGFNGTDWGRVYKKYQFDCTKATGSWLFTTPSVCNSNAWSYNAPGSLIMTREGKLYFGLHYINRAGGALLRGFWLPQVIFYEDSGTYSFAWEKIPQMLYHANYDNFKTIEANVNNVLLAPKMASNGNNIFVYSLGTPEGRDGYSFQVFDTNWRLIKEFSVFDVPDDTYLRTLGGGLRHFLAADSEYLYMNRFTQIIDWRKEEFVTGQWTPQFYTKEYHGHYDWKNNKYWLGSAWNDVPHTSIHPVDQSKHNRLYRYSECEIKARDFCRTDEDCLACGPGTSSCIDGLCTPYIRNFSPLSGAVGTWVTLEGCYFGCGNGRVYFTGIDEDTGEADYNKLAFNVEEEYPDCGTSWRCSYDYAENFDQVIIEAPNKNILPNMDCPIDNCPPPGYDPNDAIDGPIMLMTADGLPATTEHLTPSDFDVNDVYGPQICNLIPEKGPRGEIVRVVGENFGDFPEPENNDQVKNDQVKFEPTQETFGEPFIDANNNSQYDLGEAFTDIDGNEAWSSNLEKNDYSFEITSFINNQTRADCPANDGWDNRNIVFRCLMTRLALALPEIQLIIM